MVLHVFPIPIPPPSSQFSNTVSQISLYDQKFFLGLPSGREDKNPAANAGAMGLIPGPGRCHVPWAAPTPVLQSLGAVANRARAPRACAGQREKAPRGATRALQEEWALLVTARERDLHKQKIKNIKIITIVFLLTFLFCSLK